VDSRHQKAIEIADKFRITNAHGRWTVPSQNSARKYSVIIQNHIAKCDCPDFELRLAHCKHILAVQIVIQREQNPDGSTTVTESVTVTRRKTYPQNWPAYNQAQTNEQDLFLSLLRDLVHNIPTPPQQSRGRHTLPLADMIFSAAYKVYSTFSGRRFMSELREAQQCGYIGVTPHYNSIFNYFENESLTPILTNLVIQSSLPLKAVEVDFACDSSGFSTGRFERWYDHKYGATKMRQEWVKVHLMCGVKTNVVTAVEVGHKFANDGQFMPAMVHTTSRNFTVAEVSADKAYLTVANTRAVAKAGGVPFIAFKSNSTADGTSDPSIAWQRMYHFFMFRRDEFLEHYHKRSNVEATFSMIKRKFGDSLRSKTDVAMINEALCKILCHNIVVVIHAMFELGIDPDFWAGLRPAQQIPS
jgi:transposase